MFSCIYRNTCIYVYICDDGLEKEFKFRISNTAKQEYFYLLELHYIWTTSTLVRHLFISGSLTRICFLSIIYKTLYKSRHNILFFALISFLNFLLPITFLCHINIIYLRLFPFSSYLH